MIGGQIGPVGHVRKKKHAQHRAPRRSGLRRSDGRPNAEPAVTWVSPRTAAPDTLDSSSRRNAPSINDNRRTSEET